VDNLWENDGALGTARLLERHLMNASPQRFLPFSAALTAVGAALALSAMNGNWLPATLWHLVFAVGALPMVLLAMAYFVPVLTRSSDAPRLLAAAPLAALAAGVAIVGYFAHGTLALRLDAPWLALLGVAGFGAWLALRWQRCIGHPNPCLRWYAAALALLALGLIAVGIAPYSPEQTRALRLFHIHINTLGFLGLTALGTLRVLLPTVAGRPDAAAAPRLVRDLKWSVGGALAIAAGAALAPTLAWLGAALYFWPLARLVVHAWQTWRHEIVAAGSSLPLLTAALLGLGLVLGHGVLHAQHADIARGDIALFVIAFLLPLVSGAAGHLLPVWLWPGPQQEWHRDARRRLARGARLRGGLLLLGGLLAANGLQAGYVLGIVCAAWLLLGMLAVLMRRRR
jgi:hypothetical protein